MEDKALDNLIDSIGGIVPAVGDVFDPLSKKELKEIESGFDYDLPRVVISLLTRFGAFRFNEYVYYTPTKPFPKSYSKTNRGILGVFFGKPSKAYPKAKAISLARQIEMHGEDFAEDFLPIADNGAGDIIGVRLGTGAVELWVHDAAAGKEVCHVNKSFDDWLASLEN
jgi:hypothetical protein